VTKYTPGPSLDPRENRLTEVTAAVLEEVPEFAPIFVRHLLADEVNSQAFRQDSPGFSARIDEIERSLAGSASGPPRVRTQVATVAGRFVDIEVAFSDPYDQGRTGLRVWTEVKDAADQHDEQLLAYLKDLGKDLHSSSSFVALLVPSWWKTRTEVPNEVPVADWHGVAVRAKELAASINDPLKAWLLNQYVQYLEEEQLTVPDRRRLTKFSAQAMMEERSIEETGVGLWEAAQEYVEENWGPVRVDDSGRRLARLDFDRFWAQFQTAPAGDVHPGWRKAWFELGWCETPELRADLDLGSDVALYAGATFYEKGEADEAIDESWMSRRALDVVAPATNGLRLVKLAGYQRVFSFTLPAHYLGGETLEKQGNELGEWAISVFRSLTIDPPPWHDAPGVSV
jgi:hypothetical protein